MTDEQILEKELIGTRKPHINHFYNDGGRSKYFKGEKVGDCVVRAIAVAANLDYKEVYDELWKRNKQYLKRNKENSVTRALEKRGCSPRNGNYKEIYNKYITDLGFKWTATMGIGTGMVVHVKQGELPTEGNLILKLSRHLSSVINGELHDTYDCSREGTRGVYGYWIK